MTLHLSAPLPRTLSQRLWDALGFRQSFPRHSVMEGDPRFAPGALANDVKADLDWPTRLRILLSGRLVVRVRTITDVPVGLSISTATLSVGRPGEPL